jgi:hypothetical protein
VLSSDNSTANTSRRFRASLRDLGVAHRRGYRDPESEAFIESWFSKLKERLVWRCEFETLDQAGEEIAGYIDRYHHRPHSGLGYRTPLEVRATWEDPFRQNTRPEVNGEGVQASATLAGALAACLALWHATDKPRRGSLGRSAVVHHEGDLLTAGRLPLYQP